ncbi:MAG: hypothetical protein ACPHVL_05710 [Psychroflexus salarius]
MLKTILRGLLKVLAGLVALLLLSFVVLKLVYNAPVPSGKSGQAADMLAQQMLEAINHNAFTEAKAIHWSFRETNHYKWFKQEHQVQVSWKDYQVNLQTKSPQQSQAYKGDTELTGQAKTEAIAYAEKNFNNDSFWLIAPHKLFDPGTKRQLIRADGQEKLLVTYTSGGSTPGDSYLWTLNEQHIPVSMQLWVRIIPFDRITAEWLNWQPTKAGFPLPEERRLWGFKIPISDVKVIP